MMINRSPQEFKVQRIRVCKMANSKWRIYTPLPRLRNHLRKGAERLQYLEAVDDSNDTVFFHSIM